MARAQAWLDRLCDRSVIRQRGVIDHVACRDRDSGERRLVLATRETELAELFDRIARVHEALRHPHVPALDERTTVGGLELVVLRSAAIADLDTLVPVALAGARLSPAAGAAFLFAVIDTIRAAHAHQVCIGSFAGSNLVVSATGDFEVIGWGYPTSETERRVMLRDDTAAHVAWEAAFGAHASPNGDLDAVGRFFHHLVPATALPLELAAAVSGDAGQARTRELVRLIGALEEAAHARDPAQRSWARYVETLERITALLAVTPDREAMRRELAGICARWRAATHLRVTADASAVTVSGRRIELDTRPSLRNIVTLLVARRRDAPGEPLTAEALLAAGWPGEQVGVEAGRNRVRVAVSTLRSLGLREVLIRRGDGYLLDPDVAITVD